jgi:hypothetical protein
MTNGSNANVVAGSAAQGNGEQIQLQCYFFMAHRTVEAAVNAAGCAGGATGRAHRQHAINVVVKSKRHENSSSVSPTRWPISIALRYRYPSESPPYRVRRPIMDRQQVQHAEADADQSEKGKRCQAELRDCPA